MTSSESASVLATSGGTSAEGDSIHNRKKLSYLVDAFSTHWSDAARVTSDAEARDN